MLMRHIILGSFLLTTILCSNPQNGPGVYFQTHRGAIDEAPENTLAALRHAWQFPGAVPEVDVRTTRDSVLICLHDTSLARTTDAPPGYQNKNVSDILFEQLRTLDAGSHFDVSFKGERIPTLEQVFSEMGKEKGRQLYLDVKGADLDQLKKLIDRYEIEHRIIFVHSNRNRLLEIKSHFPKSKTMTWIGGDKSEILNTYSEYKQAGFEGIDQLQLHLKARKQENKIVYELDDQFLSQVLNELNEHNKTLQVRPFLYNANALKRLLNIGIHWYVTDAPEDFYNTLQKAVD